MIHPVPGRVTTTNSRTLVDADAPAPMPATRIPDPSTESGAPSMRAASNRARSMPAAPQALSTSPPAG
jgi:hypothetical protein